jgi:peptidoglycan/xylan/chitin deacetylase (PgdA/CDA1 family)
VAGQRGQRKCATVFLMGGNARLRRPPVAAVAAVLVVIGLIAAWIGQRAGAGASGQPKVAWKLSPASNTVTIRLTPGSGPSARQVLGHSQVVVAQDGKLRPVKGPLGGGKVQIAVPPGQQSQFVVLVKGPQPSRQTLVVTVPPPLRVVASRSGSAGVLVRASIPLRRQARGPLCGADKISFPSSSEAAVAKSPTRCRARLRLTAADGEQAVVRLTVPSLPKIPLYSFASPAGRAIYITVDDGWTPSPQVLDIMRKTHLPVTAFLIQDAAQENLPYWRAFVAAGGTIGDHTVSHPVLTKLSLAQDTFQWGHDRLQLGKWLGQTPVMGRPPYGAFDPAVEAAAYQGGLKVLAGWSVVVDSDGISTWDDRPLEAGEIVLLHWLPGLGQQMVKLLKVIHHLHLNPTPLTPASFAGQTPQTKSLDGD